MNGHDKLIERIERDEAWLAECVTPQPDSLAIERVKYVVRAACGECHDEALEARSAISAAKAAVRRELLPQRVGRRSPWRLAGPMLAVAAAVAFGAFRLAMDTQQVSAVDPTFAAFVQTMTRATSDFDLSLSALDRDVDDLGDDGLAMSHAEWTTDWIDGVGENLDSLSDELGSQEQM